MGTKGIEIVGVDDPFVETILKQNIQGERCAIGFYKRLLESIQGKDPVTYNVVLQILQDEVARGRSPVSTRRS